MYRIKIFTIVAAIALSTLACNFTFNQQVQGVSVGSLETYEIEVPSPDSNEISEVRLEFGAGELNLSPGSDEYLVSGTATYNAVSYTHLTLPTILLV